MSLGGTRSYDDLPHGMVVPDLVLAAVAAGKAAGFELNVRPEIGRMQAVLAGGVPAGGHIGETGTGTGAGLAWMVSAAAPDVSFTSIELDPVRADAARAVFADHPNVDIITGDATGIVDYGPFDLLVLDGGPGSGKDGREPVEPAATLRPGGSLTVDDYTPFAGYPPTFKGEPDHSRMHWFEHPEADTTEIRLADDLSMLVVRYRG